MSFQLSEKDLLLFQSAIIDKMRANHSLLSHRGYKISGQTHDVVQWTRSEAEVRCYSCMCGGPQCVKQIGHEPTDHKYENNAGESVPRSTYINSACLIMELEA